MGVEDEEERGDVEVSEEEEDSEYQRRRRIGSSAYCEKIPRGAREQNEGGAPAGSARRPVRAQRGG